MSEQKTQTDDLARMDEMLSLLDGNEQRLTIRVGDIASIPIFNRAGVVVARTLIDVDDIERVEQGSLHMRNEYVTITFNKKDITLSHFIGGIPPPGMIKDHINQNKVDNRKVNLRTVTVSQNNQNKRKRHPDTAGSQYIGVYHDLSSSTKPWIATVRVAKYKKRSKCFQDEWSAVRFHDSATLFYDHQAYTNGSLSPLEIEQAKVIEPEFFVKKDNLPKHIKKVTYGNRDSFAVSMTVFGKPKNATFQKLTDAIDFITKQESEIKIAIERRHLAKVVTRNEHGQPFIVLNKTKDTSRQFHVVVDEKFWHQIERWNWNWKGDKRKAPTGQVGGRNMFLHRFIYELVHAGEIIPLDMIVTHLNNNQLDCQAVNLRLISHSILGHKCSKSANKELPKNITKYRNKFIVNIERESKRFWASFDTLENAITTNREASKNMFPELQY